MAALEESGLNVEVLRGSWSGRRRRAGVETRRAHAAEIVVVADRLLLASDLHFFILFVPVFPVYLFEVHCHLAELLEGLPRQHHFFAVAEVAVEELLHHVHVRDDQRVESLEVSCWVKLRY